MRQKALVMAVAALTTAGVGTFTAVSAQASPRHLAQAVHPAATSQTERGLIVSTSQKANPHVLLSGAFTVAGVDKPVNGKTDKLYLGNGTLEILHPGGTFHSKRYPSTCTFVGHVKGAYTLGHGTGAYKNVTGQGHYVAQFSARGPRKNGKCVKTNNPGVGFNETIVATGTETGL